MLEELLAAGHAGAEYDAWLIDIGEGDQFGSGFVAINPNCKIPALLDRSDPARPQRVFESGAILLYLAEKFGAFLPTDPAARTETLSWLMWQMGSAPVPRRRLRPFLRLRAVQDRICRSTATRWRRSASMTSSTATSPTTNIMAGDDYTIADMAIWPWYGAVADGAAYDGAATFLGLADYATRQPLGRRGRRPPRGPARPPVNRKPTDDQSRFRARAALASDLD